MQRALAVLGTLTLMLLAGCAQEEATPDQVWLTHLQNQDVQDLMAHYEENATLTVNERVYSGKSQISNYWTSRFNGREVITDLTDILRRYDRDRIVVQGMYANFYPQPDGMVSGNFFQLWVTDGLDWYIQEERWQRIDEDDPEDEGLILPPG